MAAFRKIVAYSASIALLLNAVSFSAKAQTYETLIEQNPERAAGVYHYYEYSPSALTKAPKGYKAFYISHYGRHGSRYHTSAGLFKEAVESLGAAEKSGLLTPEGKLLKARMERNGDLEFHYVTGPKYLDYISMDLDTKDVMKKAKNLRKHLRDSLVSYDRFFEAIFTDKAKAVELVQDPRVFMDNVFVAGCISPNTQGRPDIFSHFTDSELVSLWIPRNNHLYFSFGISAEEGDYVASIAKPLINDIVAKADAAVKPESGRAADLRFGHDVGLLPLIGALNIKGMEERWNSLEAHRHWNAFEMMPMASNLQMIFFRNKKGDVIVKLVYNDKETSIPALKAFCGPFYKWEDLREYLVETATAITDENIVKDGGDKERTGVSGM